ncbi:hypothetical protein CR194_09050 [Salipaludibacillus keqinensis]|uniref:Spore coat protein n=1 Tax=Salipaludibacillus keqinensis TaxID=2045207 RepID=A0A323TFN1_9BACI|nr:YppG family protein [Salipaludibacillus keqinensis]PYZ93330.1 hypothetical protein CR194_09050 [Salipaludibacillus keqinensis]
MFFQRPQSYQPYDYQPPYHTPPHHWHGHQQPPFYQQGPYQGYPPQYHQQQPGGYPAPFAQQKPASKLMSAFQTNEGKFDFQKAMTTMDQVVKTANQVSPFVKQVGSFFTTK